MTEVALRPLDSRGKAFVRNQLREVNAFCDCLDNVVSRHAGEAFAYAPTGVDDKRLYNFSEGGLLPENLDFSRAIRLPPGQGTMLPVASLIEERAERILQVLGEVSGSVCIIDAVNPEWGDPTLAGFAGAFGVGKEVYHLLHADDARDVVVRVLADADALWHGVAAVCTRAPIIGVERTTSLEELRLSADAVIEITCSAYDGESFVGWRRRTQ